MIRVVYNEKQVADPGRQPWADEGYVPSPSAQKPMQLAEQLRYQSAFQIEFIEPRPVTVDDFKSCHSAKYVDGVMSLKLPNGFGTFSQSVIDSLPYTTGAMWTAAIEAKPDAPVAALVSGFHHAEWNGQPKGYAFCTFNGLAVTAAKLVKELGKRVLIIDCDMHYGNGLEDILLKADKAWTQNVCHCTFGAACHNPEHAYAYLESFTKSGHGCYDVPKLFETFRPDVVLYQAGADVHINDPYGGIFTTEEIYERDRRMFLLAKQYEVPLAWNLAGGYQIDEDGSIQKVLDIHLNTFKAAADVY